MSRRKKRKKKKKAERMSANLLEGISNAISDQTGRGHDGLFADVVDAADGSGREYVSPSKVPTLKEVDPDLLHSALTGDFLRRLERLKGILAGSSVDLESVRRMARKLPVKPHPEEPVTWEELHILERWFEEHAALDTYMYDAVHGDQHQ
jgi:hypothetical protein